MVFTYVMHKLLLDMQVFFKDIVNYEFNVFSFCIISLASKIKLFHITFFCFVRKESLYSHERVTFLI